MANAGSLVDALRTVPGLDITESGGPGSTTNIRLRGANTGQTLVLIDGIRVNDPTAASGDFDFSLIADRGERRFRFFAERPGPVQRPNRSRQLRHGFDQRFGDRLLWPVVLCRHGQWRAQQRLFPLRLPHSIDRSEIPES